MEEDSQGEGDQDTGKEEAEAAEKGEVCGDGKGGKLLSGKPTCAVEQGGKEFEAHKMKGHNPERVAAAKGEAGQESGKGEKKLAADQAEADSSKGTQKAIGK